MTRGDGKIRKAWQNAGSSGDYGPMMLRLSAECPVHASDLSWSAGICRWCFCTIGFRMAVDGSAIEGVRVRPGRPGAVIRFGHYVEDFRKDQAMAARVAICRAAARRTSCSGPLWRHLPTAHTVGAQLGALLGIPNDH